jgi:hypothetical protein
MKENIYTIPVNEAFDLCSGCPICALYKKLEDDELEIILGAAMMESDTRIQTNAMGFCGKHFDIMFVMQKRLPLALMIESHLSNNTIKKLKSGLPGSQGKNKKYEKQKQSCYICNRVDHSLGLMLETVALLWQREKEFREKLLDQPFFCLDHYPDILNAASYTIPKKLYSEFAGSCKKVMVRYAEKLYADVEWFGKKFDYNNQGEPWGDSKDSVERAIKFLSGYRNLDTIRKQYP